MNHKKNYSSVLSLIALSLFVFLFVFFMYTFLHEAGHALAGRLFGQMLTEFDVSFWDLSAHVGLTAGELTQTQLAIRSAAGTILPLSIWAIFIILVPRKSVFTVEALKLISSMTLVNTLLVWIIIPLLFMAGRAPSDDVMNFLVYSLMPPLLLSFIALVLYAGGWILFLSKIDGLRNEFLIFRITDPQKLKEGARSKLPIMAGIMAFCAILAFTLNASASTNPSGRFSPPRDFSPTAQIDLSTRSYSSEPIARFRLDQPSYAGIFVVIHNIDTPFFDLSVEGPDGYRNVILHGEGYRADQDGGLWEKSLPPGTYELVLTSHPSPGAVSVYLKNR